MQIRIVLFVVLNLLLRFPAAYAQAPKVPVENQTSTRGEVVLNDIWQFVPGSDAPKEDAGWGEIKVPGDWGTNDGGSRPGLVKRGSGEAWKAFEGRKTALAIYQRLIQIPKEWDNRAVLLDLGRVSTDARVFLDGVPCGSVTWPAGAVELTKAAKPGTTQTLRIIVAAATDVKEIPVFMESATAQVGSKPAELEARGLIGDVVLQSRPKSAFIESVFIQPSVRKKRLELDVELAGVKSGEMVTFTATLESAQGRFEKQFTVRVAAAPKVRIGFAWDNPKLWDIGTPHLYTLRLKASGVGIRDEAREVFGFREIWTQGRDFYLNGSKLRLRPTILPEGYSATEGTTELIDAALSGLQRSGYNFGELWPNDVDERGRLAYHDRWAECADRAGFLINGTLPSIHPYVSGSGYVLHWDSQKRDAWLARCAPVLRRLRNHPSIIMWAPSANFFGTDHDQNPRNIGRPQVRNQWGVQAAAAGREGLAQLKALDPTRLAFTHQGSDIGDVFSVNNYLCFLPLQEREEWLHEWARTGTMPYMAVEFGTPLFCSFLRGRNGFGENIKTEPWLSEFAAIYLGRDAYAQETPLYRQEMLTQFTGGQTYKGWQGNESLQRAPSFQKIQELFSTNTWRSWRTIGITGGMIAWDRGHGWFESAWGKQMVSLSTRVAGRRGTSPAAVPRAALAYFRSPVFEITPGGAAILKNNTPTLAWIAGSPATFTEKAHNFSSGQRVLKSIALLNDTRTVQPYKAFWSVVVGGKPLAKGTLAGTLGIAETKLLPLSVVLPRVTSRSEGSIFLTASIGSARHTDQFNFRVFGNPMPLKKQMTTVSVLDRVGETTKLLKALGYIPKPWTGEEKTPLVIVGRKALSKSKEPGLILSQLRRYISRGGRVLVMGQDPDWLRDVMGFRVTHHATRRVFRLSPNHPVTAGLDDTDLRDWDGEGTLTMPRPEYAADALPQAPTKMPYWGWRWGNRGSVAGTVIEKPHRAGWRPLLECEFDLAYSPLMELDYGKGRVTLCTLDLEDQALLDPAARQLAQNLLRHVAQAPLVARRTKTVLVGGTESDAALLDSVGIVYESGALASDTLALIGTGFDASQDIGLRAFLAEGGKALVLPRAVGTAPLSVSLLAKTGFTGALSVPNAHEFRGLSSSDLRARNSVTVAAIDGELLSSRTVGRGTIVYFQADPRTLLATEKTYLRFTRWRWTRALTQVLANLGARFTMDERFFTPGHTNPENGIVLGENWAVKLTQALPPAEKGISDPGISEAANALLGPLKDKKDSSGWETLKQAAYWPLFETTLGEAVFRKTIEVPAAWGGKDLVMTLGAIDDYDTTFWNGEAIGTTQGWNTRREYIVPGRLVKAGKAVIAIRCFNNFGGGGLGGPVDAMYVLPKGESRLRDGLYDSDYRTDFELGDDPYRYFRW